MEKKISWPLVIAIVLSIAVAITSSLALRQHVLSNKAVTKVLVAKNNINPYTVLTDSHLVWLTVPEGSEQSGTLQNPKDIIGRMNVVPLFKNEQIHMEKLANPGLTIQDGERAMAIPTNNIKSVGGYVKPADLVDLYWVSNPDLPSVLLSQRARVLGMVNKEGQRIENSGSQDKGIVQAVSDTISESAINANAVIVIINENDAAMVARAVIGGDVVMAKCKPPITQQTNQNVTENSPVEVEQPEQSPEPSLENPADTPNQNPVPQNPPAVPEGGEQQQ